MKNWLKTNTGICRILNQPCKLAFLPLKRKPKFDCNNCKRPLNEGLTLTDIG